MNRLLELFSGTGGASLGLRRAGWDHLACVEWNAAAAETLRAANFPAVEADVRDIHFRPWRGKVDLFWASPPCQAGSAAGKRRGEEDDRNGWPWTFDALDEVQPTWFLAENVVGWTYHREHCEVGGPCTGCYWERSILPALSTRFPFSGFWKLNAADYGVPQHRRRVILWGGPLPLSPDGPPKSHADPTDTDDLLEGRKPWITLEEAIGDTLLDPDTCGRRACYACTLGRACREHWRRHAPAPTVTTMEEKGTRANAASGFTFNGGPDRASDTAFLVAGVRRIDVAEGLKLQNFPADWPLRGTRHDHYTQVGNAVPPALAEACGRLVRGAHAVWTGLRRDGVNPVAMGRMLQRRGLELGRQRP